MLQPTLLGREWCVERTALHCMWIGPGSAADNTAKIWDRDTGECKLTLSGHTDDMRTAIVTPDKSMVLTVSYDKTAKLWDIDTGECERTLQGSFYPVMSVCVSHDGKRIV